MCILSDGTMCIQLSPAERLAQHNFEERKGPYPKALADRLHEEGIMSREVHFRESLMRRQEHIAHYIDQAWRFSPTMDCSTEERDFMLGNRHDLPMDFFLPHRLAKKMLAGFTAARKEKFRRYLIGPQNARMAPFMLAYPEFTSWFGEFIVEYRLPSRNLNRAIDIFIEKPGVLYNLTRTIPAPTLKSLVEKAFLRFFRNNKSTFCLGTVALIRPSIPEGHISEFDRLVELRRAVSAASETYKTNRTKRRQRKLLSKQVEHWVNLLQSDPLIARNCIEGMLDRLLVPFVETPTEPTLLAA